MRPIDWQDVLSATAAKPWTDAGGTRLLGVSTDTRTLRPGELFIALRGPNFDGNRYAQRAVQAGAGGLLLRAPLPDEPELELPDVLPVATHPDPRRALADLASWYRSTLSARVVGITGSCGKTTTKNIVHELFRERLRVVSSPASFNNEIGVPHTLFLADDDTELIALEIGTNHPGEIASLCRIARPDAGIITNIGSAHLAGLGSIEGVAREKGALAEALDRSGFLVLNSDCRFARELRSRTAARVYSFSVEGEPGAAGDLDATDLYFHSGGTTFRLGDREVTSPLLGTHNVQNLLAALSLCPALGVPLEEALARVPYLSSERQRMERIELDDVTIFDDSYNANPDSLRAAVRVLAGLHGFDRRVLVLGDMLELGDEAGVYHHRVGLEAAQEGIDLLVLVGELTQAAAAGALEGGLAKECVVYIPEPEAAAEQVLELVQAGDVVLIKGSRRMALESIVERLVADRQR